MVKAIIFDFWGTLVENGIFPSPVKQVKFIIRAPMSFRDFVTKFEETMMTKPYEDMNEAFISVCDAFNIRYNDYVIERLVGMWNKNELLAKPFLETLEVLEYLKTKKIKVGLITDSTPTITRVLEKFDLNKYFDAIAFSYEEGLLKTNPELFQLLAKKLKAKPEEIIVVGDSMPTDIIGSHNAGLRAILLDRRNKRGFSPKIVNLRELKDHIDNGTLDEFASQKPVFEQEIGETE